MKWLHFEARLEKLKTTFIQLFGNICCLESGESVPYRFVPLTTAAFAQIWVIVCVKAPVLLSKIGSHHAQFRIVHFSISFLTTRNGSVRNDVSTGVYVLVPLYSCITRRIFDAIRRYWWHKLNMLPNGDIAIPSPTVIVRNFPGRSMLSFFSVPSNGSCVFTNSNGGYAPASSLLGTRGSVCLFFLGAVRPTLDQCISSPFYLKEYRLSVIGSYIFGSAGWIGLYVWS